MAITNGYCDLPELREWLGLEDPLDDKILERAANAASRAIDKYCGRIFYKPSESVAARVYVADDPLELVVHDFSTTAGLIVKTDDNADGTFETTWSSTGSPADYQAEPLVRENGYPYTRIVAIDDKGFPVSRHRALVEITALWGWAEVPDDVEQACLIKAARLIKRRETSTGVIGFDGIGATVRVGRDDPDVKELLADFRRFSRPSAGTGD